MTEVEKFKTLVIPDGRVPVAAYQAIYHRITQHTEKIGLPQPHAYRVTIESIKELVELLDQSTRQYRVEAKSIEISCTFSDRSSETYSSFERFSLVNFAIRSAATAGVGIFFDFLVVLPIEIENAPDIAQRYKVGVIINEQPIKQERPAYVRGDFTVETDVVTVEYADRAVANHLISVVSGWFDSHVLERSDGAKVRHLRRLGKWGSWLPGSLPVFALLGGALFDVGKVSDALTPTRYLILVGLVAFSVAFVGEKLSQYVNRTVFSLVPGTRIVFTAGDKQREDLIEKTESRARRSLGVVSVGIVLATLVAIFANFISAKILSL